MKRIINFSREGIQKKVASLSLIPLLLNLIMVGTFVAPNTARATSPNYQINVTSQVIDPLSLTLSGEASATHFVGQKDQQHVSIKWGDGKISENIMFDPIFFNNDFWGSWGTITHVYDVAGLYTITAIVHHSKLAGNESGDASQQIDVIIPQATLTVIKHVVNDGGDMSASDFTMNVTGTNVSKTSFPGSETGTVVNLDAGIYNADEEEILNSNYIKSLGADCSGMIASGEEKTCTITNTYVAQCVPSTEVCDGQDNDCDGEIDEDVKSTFYQDSDGDIYGNASVTIQACSALTGYVLDNTDCNDENVNINPGATEICNGIDDNCNQQVDEGGVCSINSYYCDNDQDTYLSAMPTGTCDSYNCVPSGCSTTQGNDCNDENVNINPGATEICNGVDDNCNDHVDEGVKSTFYQDSDGDIYGNASVTTQACSAPTGYVSDNTDCNDTDSAIHPNAQEVCNGVDDNCNDQVDEGVTSIFYQDFDDDNYGNPSITTQACLAPQGYVSDSTDCNDENANVNPGAVEICNGIDDDCDGATDEGELWANKGDSCTVGIGVCQAAGAYVCDGQNSACATVCSATAGEPIAEICDNQLDDDCDGYTDTADTDCQACIPENTQLCETGQLGVCSSGLQVCGQTGFWGECAQTNQPVAEICGNGLDDDCDSVVDNGCQPAQYCGDGACNNSETCSTCSQDCGLCVSGSSGGSTVISKPIIIITNEKVVYLGNGNAKVTWTTNIETTEQVAYGDNSISVLGATPKYGYDSVDEESDFMVKNHSVIIGYLTDGISYYFRPIADRAGSTGEKVGIEVSYKPGEVKGVTDTPAPAAPVECNYLLEYIRLGADNNPVEVMKIETFLNVFEGENLIVNGIYEQADFDAVSRFQEKYGEQILSPWSYDSSTGYVYITTKNRVNEIYCQKDFPLTPEQEAEINAFVARFRIIPVIRREETGTELEEPTSGEEQETGETTGTEVESGENTQNSPNNEQSMSDNIIGNQDQEQEQAAGQSSLTASLASIVTLGTGKAWVGFLVGIIAMLVIGRAMYYFIQEERRKDKNQKKK